MKRKIYFRIKVSLKKTSTWAVVLTALLLLAVLMGISVPDSAETRIGIILGDSSRAERIIKRIEESESIFEIVEYEDRDRLIKDLKKGTMECGLVFNSDFDQNISEGKLKEQIEYISSPYTTKGLVVREVVYASFLKEFGQDILDEEFPKLFEGVSDVISDEEVREYMHNSYGKYLESTDIFTVDFR